MDAALIFLKKIYIYIYNPVTQTLWKWMQRKRAQKEQAGKARTLILLLLFTIVNARKQAIPLSSVRFFCVWPESRWSFILQAIRSWNQGDA